MPKPLCLHDGCGVTAFSRGRCNTHYKRDRSNGTLSKITEQDRFWAKVSKDGDCWAWVGSFRRDGYGQFQFRGANWAAHRASWVIHRGPIPEGMYLDHICHDKACVRPDHLRLATVVQNNEYRAGAQSNSTTGIRGISYDKDRQKWVARVARNRKWLFNKRFDTLEEAEVAVREARARFHTFPEPVALS